MQIDLFSSPQFERIDLPDADIRVSRNWLDPQKVQTLFQECLELIQWEQPDLWIGGKKHKIPRLQCWVGNPSAIYTFSGRQFTPCEWTEFLQVNKRLIESELQYKFNSVLLNLYRDGQDCMGLHSDDEPELGLNPVIASLSLGGARRFLLKRKGRGEKSFNIELKSGDLLVMAGATQQYWLHGIARTRQFCSPRINLTYRYIHPLT